MVEGFEIAQVVAASEASDDAGGEDGLAAVGIAEEAVDVVRNFVVHLNRAFVIGEAILIDAAEITGDAQCAASGAVGLRQLGEHAAGEASHGDCGPGREDHTGGDTAAQIVGESERGADIERKDAVAHS